MISGELDVALPRAAGARPGKAGESFEVPANSKFRMVVKTLTDYCCTFIAS
ncbi:MAG: pyrimidine/purine nucleoside phosphorylase [Candidatus Binatia bacterium]